MNDDAKPYQVTPEKARYLVQDDSGRTVVSCGDAASADNYTVLLNEAYRRGFKAGYREGKREQEGAGQPKG